MNEKIISDISRHGKTARGKKELIKHLEGGRLTLKQAMLAKCFDCTGYFADGKVDCKCPKCSLHPFMAFNENRLKRKNNQARQ
jgi:Zn finger protein HypA/HybF involved in hydrogenase expression